VGCDARSGGTGGGAASCSNPEASRDEYPPQVARTNKSEVGTSKLRGIESKPLQAWFRASERDSLIFELPPSSAGSCDGGFL
jgi:hypothetical protein